MTESKVYPKSYPNPLFSSDLQTTCLISTASFLTIWKSKTLSLVTLMATSLIVKNTTFHLLAKRITLFIEVNYELCTEISLSHYLIFGLCCYYVLLMMIWSFVFVILFMISFSFLTSYCLGLFSHHIRRLKSLIMQCQIRILLTFRYSFQAKFIMVPYTQNSFSTRTRPWFYRSLKNTVLSMNQFLVFCTWLASFQSQTLVLLTIKVSILDILQ